MPQTKRIFGVAVIAGILALGGVACGGGGGGSAADFCALEGKYDNIDQNDTKAFAKAMQEMKAKAPAEIKGDVTYLADAMSKIPSDIDESDPQAAMDAMKDIDLEKVTKASENIEKYIDKHCK